MEVDMQIFPPGIMLGFQIEFFRPNRSFFSSTDEFFITPSNVNKDAPFKIINTPPPRAQVPLEGIVSVVLKIYYENNLITMDDLAGENYNFLNERMIPSDLAAKPANSRKRVREPDHASELDNMATPGEDMDIFNKKKWKKKNYTNWVELDLVVKNINTLNRICEVEEYECVLHIENKEMQEFIFDAIGGK